MCDYRMLDLVEYVSYASRRYGLPYGFLAKKIDSVYSRIGNRIFQYMNIIDDVVSAWKGKEDLEEKLLTSLPEEAFQ